MGAPQNSHLDAPQVFPLGGSPPERRAPPGASKKLFGKDLLFIDDLFITPKGDWATVEGLENLRRAILRRLITRPGEFRVRPEYGVGIQIWVKKPMTTSNLNSLKHAIVDNLSRERRIEKVLSVDLTPIVSGSLTPGTARPGVPGLSVVVTVQALGKALTLDPFNFSREH